MAPARSFERKLHLAVDADTGEIMASDLTARRTHDCTQVPALLEQIPDPLSSISADGAYHTRAVYEAAHERGKGRAFGPSGLELELLGWIEEPVLRGRVTDALNTEVYRRFNEEKIEIPYLKQDVYIKEMPR